MRRKVLAWIAAATAALSSFSGPAHAVELLTNGDFELSTYANGGDVANNAAFAPYFNGSYGVGNGVSGSQFSYDANNDSNPWGKNFLTGWDVQGYNFLFNTGYADGRGSWNGSGPVRIAGPNSAAPANNGLTAECNLAGCGGFFIGADGASENGISLAGPISQTVNNLTIGDRYTVTFFWAAGQQDGTQYDGPTTERWDVSLYGVDSNNVAWSDTQSTATWNNVVRGFMPWTQETFTFTAQSSTATLSFLAQGTPDGQPPFSLLDSVSMQAYVPEPQTWAMMIIGFALVGGVMRTRRTPTSGRRVLNSQIV